MKPSLVHRVTSAVLMLVVALWGCGGTNSASTAPIPGSPSATLSSAALTFAATALNTATVAQTVTLTNSGTATLNISSLALAGTDAALFTLTNNCGTSLAAGSACTFSVSFKPTDTSNRTASVALVTNATPSSQSVALTATTSLPSAPAATLSATSLTFSSTTLNVATAAQTVTLTNSGTAALAISSVAVSGTDASYFTLSNACGTTLAAGSTCTFSLSFKPTDTNSRSAAVTLVTNATPATQTVALTGTFMLAPTPSVTLSVLALSFASNALNTSTATQTVTLTNSGTAALTITSLALTGTDAAYFTLTNSCGSSLAAGAACTFGVTFKSADGNSHTAAVTLVTNATPAPQTVALTGVINVASKCASSVSRKAPPAATASYTGTALSGKAMAGTLPLIGASVQLYAAGNTGNGLAPMALGAAQITDTNGAFSLAAGYTCPYNLSMLYLTARGGKAGASGAANAGTVLMTALGPCNAPAVTSGIVINEATTVASVFTLSQFLSAGGNIGASATNFQGLKLAAGSAANLVNLATGKTPGAAFPSTGTPPTLNVNALANALNTCVVAGGTPCTQLYSATTVTGSASPTNTLDAMLNLARHPAANVGAIFTLSTASTAFAPAAAAAPTDWVLFARYSGGGMNAPAGLGIDSLGNIAVSNYFDVASLFTNTGVPVVASGVTGYTLHNSYGLAVDQTDQVWIPNEQGPSSVNSGFGSVTVLITAAATSTGTYYSAGGLNFPLAIAFDQAQTAWVVDYGNAHLTLLGPAGTPLSGASGYTTSQFIFPVAVATDSKCYGYLANQSSTTVTRIANDGSNPVSYILGDGPSGLAVDSADNLWSANYYGAGSVGLLSASGTVLGSYLTGGGIQQPQGIAVDGANNAWVASFRGTAISEFAAASSGNPGAALSPTTGFGKDSGLLEAYAIAIDAAGNIWVTNFGNNTLTEFLGLAVPVRTPIIGPMALP